MTREKVVAAYAGAPGRLDRTKKESRIQIGYGFSLWSWVCLQLRVFDLLGELAFLFPPIKKISEQPPKRDKHCHEYDHEKQIFQTYTPLTI